MAEAVGLGNGMGNAAKGVHLASMGALWQAAAVGFGGAHPDGLALRIDPRLPPTWTGLSFPLHWRGARIEVTVRPNQLLLALDGQADLAVGRTDPQRFSAGRYRASRVGERWSRLEPAR